MFSLILRNFTFLLVALTLAACATRPKDPSEVPIRYEIQNVKVTADDGISSDIPEAVQQQVDDAVKATTWADTTPRADMNIVLLSISRHSGPEGFHTDTSARVTLTNVVTGWTIATRNFEIPAMGLTAARADKAAILAIAARVRAEYDLKTPIDRVEVSSISPKSTPLTVKVPVKAINRKPAVKKAVILGDDDGQLPKAKKKVGKDPRKITVLTPVEIKPIVVEVEPKVKSEIKRDKKSPVLKKAAPHEVLQDPNAKVKKNSSDETAVVPVEATPAITKVDPKADKIKSADKRKKTAPIDLDQNPKTTTKVEKNTTDDKAVIPAEANPPVVKAEPNAEESQKVIEPVRNAVENGAKAKVVIKVKTPDNPPAADAPCVETLDKACSSIPK